MDDSISTMMIRDHILKICGDIFKDPHFVISPQAINCSIIGTEKEFDDTLNVPTRDKGIGIEIILAAWQIPNVEVICILYERSEDGVVRGFTAYTGCLANPDMFDGLREALKRLYDGPWRRWDVIKYAVIQNIS